MIGRERRGSGDRFRREYSPTPRNEMGRNIAPPSRHLWIGNLSHHIPESALSEQCLKFGEIDSIAFQPGRSYAFVNYRKEEDAMIAMRALQGFVLAGLPLKIEFAKAERSLPSSHDEYQQRRDERRSNEHGSPFQRDSRARPTSPGSHTDNSRMGDKHAEPSEVLWIGFPSFLNVDEMLLRRSFSPFGEIEKITAFPGRSYAFVQFRTVMAACRAKEALQGKLFDNPRVSICFAKNETNALEQGRNSMNPPFSPHFNSNGHPGRSTEFRQDRNFGNSIGEPHRGSPHFTPDMELGDSSVAGFGRKGPVWMGGSGTFEPKRLQGPRSELGISKDTFEHQYSPSRKRGPQHHDLSPGRFPQKGPFYEDLSGMQDSFFFQEAKKLKTGPFPPDKELPEYPFSDSAQDKQRTGLSMTFPNLPKHEAYDKSFGSGPFSHNIIADRPMHLARPRDERDHNLNASYDRFETGSGPFPVNPVKWKQSNPELHQSPLKGEWKWEGTIAKGGTPSPVRPGILDCTARTGLDMLAKHFYQAASAWVVFFVPESDADIVLYNEFMNYLGEKQRAAVAKLGEKTSLFLVPPSDFSEKVLKVPGKLSISGVILRFQHLNSDFGSLNQPLDAMESNPLPFHGDISYHKPPSSELTSSARGPSQSYTNFSSELFPSITSFATARKPELEDLPLLGNKPGSAPSPSFPGPTHLTGRGSEAQNGNMFYQPLQHQNPQLPSNWPPHLQNSDPGTGNLLPHVSTNLGNVMNPGAVQQMSSGQFSSGMSNNPLAGGNKFSHQETKPQMPIPSLQPQQLAQLASLLVQGQQPGTGPVSSVEHSHKQSTPMNQSEHSYLLSQTTQNHASSNASTIQFGQMHQLLQQKSNALIVPQTSSADSHSQVNQPLQMTSAREEEPNPHTRLQATLQLAATLLQQIQQQGKGADQR
ncbi:hypothetical protein IFM89_005760 [Coptis chinensis]|uniref:RRM domain-containing protein n=1 Tax=Coptis chinensis TaxID=261450 RepID=A0A835IK10_9MAGN|nr:hypothetical protein IFM89_005760 [Coptis chinensis]